MTLLTTILSAQNIDDAYRWLCLKRRDYSPNSDVWELRFRWPREKTAILDQLRRGCYQFAPVQCYGIDGEVRCVWAARDALVLRAIAQVLPGFLGLHSSCLHVKGRGGIHEGVRWAKREYTEHRFHLRSDVKGYYRHIRHGVLMQQLKSEIRDGKVIQLIRRYLSRVETCGGVYCEKHQGLNKGDPLAPVLGALYLKPLDQALTDLGAYTRFMDDWLFFTNDRKVLREAIRRMHHILKRLGMRIHPDKTSMGKTVKGFDWLGLRFKPTAITIIPERLTIIKTKYQQLFELCPTRAADYVSAVKRWFVSLLWPVSASPVL